MGKVSHQQKTHCYDEWTLIYNSQLGELGGVTSGNFSNAELEKLLLELSKLALQVRLALALELVCADL